MIQAIRDHEGGNAIQWEEWILFVLKGIEDTAEQTIGLVKNISVMMTDYKRILRQLFEKQYRHPYTKIEFIEREMMVSRQTASKYLNTMVDAGLLKCTRIGKTNYYINIKLVNLFLNMNS